jgi:ribosome-associated toxin RatA of RatAB toxin-antitoxin module
MPRVRKSVLLPYSCEQMYELVAGIAHYPRFLPWCAGTSVTEQPDGLIRASVEIDYRGIRSRFATINRNHPPDSISLMLAEGPFRSLTGEWRFVRLRADACRVEFDLDYEFAGLLGRVLAPVFDHIAGSFVDAFVRRAEELHGQAS